MEVRILPIVARELEKEPPSLKEDKEFVMKKKKFYLSIDKFGTAIGLNALDKEVIRQKNRMIDYLKESRLKKGISQKELAEKLGTQQPAVGRMEAGVVGEVSFDFLIRVALALGVSLAVVPTKKAA